MHELSMAQGIINAVLETAEANNATEVNEVTVEVGRLAMINPEQLEFILGVLIENTIMEDAKIVFEEIPAEIECNDCKFHGEAILDGLGIGMIFGEFLTGSFHVRTQILEVAVQLLVHRVLLLVIIEVGVLELVVQFPCEGLRAADDDLEAVVL